MTDFAKMLDKMLDEINDERDLTEAALYKCTDEETFWKLENKMNELDDKYDRIAKYWRNITTW